MRRGRFGRLGKVRARSWDALSHHAAGQSSDGHSGDVRSFRGRHTQLRMATVNCVSCPPNYARRLRQPARPDAHLPGRLRQQLQPFWLRPNGRSGHRRPELHPGHACLRHGHHRPRTPEQRRHGQRRPGHVGRAGLHRHGKRGRLPAHALRWLGVGGRKPRARLSADDFNGQFSDVNAGDSLQSVQITALPQQGDVAALRQRGDCRPVDPGERGRLLGPDGRGLGQPDLSAGRQLHRQRQLPMDGLRRAVLLLFGGHGLDHGDGRAGPDPFRQHHLGAGKRQPHSHVGHPLRPIHRPRRRPA